MNNSQTPAEPITKDVIVTEAASLFSERGYRRTKVTDIARAAGITHPSLYWHFSSKEEILFEYLRGGLVEFNSQIETALDGCGNESEQLRALAIAHTRAQLEFRDKAKAVLSFTHSATQLSADLSNERVGHIRALIREHIDRTRALIDRGIVSGEFNVPNAAALTYAVLNMCEYSAVWFRPDGGSTAVEVAEANGELAVRMAVGCEGFGQRGEKL